MKINEILGELHKIEFARFTEIPSEWKYHQKYPNTAFTLFGTKKSFLTTIDYRGATFQRHEFKTEVIIARGIVIDFIIPPEPIERMSDNDKKWTSIKNVDEDILKIKSYYGAFGQNYFIDYCLPRIVEGIKALA